MHADLRTIRRFVRDAGKIGGIREEDPLSCRSADQDIDTSGFKENNHVSGIHS